LHFFLQNTAIFHFLQKNTPPFHFLPTGLVCATTTDRKNMGASAVYFPNNRGKFGWQIFFLQLCEVLIDFKQDANAGRLYITASP